LPSRTLEALVARRGRSHTAQSNVTQRIRGIELELGVQLFHRSKRGVTFTSMGSRLLPYAERIRDLLQEAQRA